MRLLSYGKPVTPALIRADVDLTHTRNASI
jgi:hypothetical protein